LLNPKIEKFHICIFDELELISIFNEKIRGANQSTRQSDGCRLDRRLCQYLHGIDIDESMDSPSIKKDQNLWEFNQKPAAYMHALTDISVLNYRSTFIFSSPGADFSGLFFTVWVRGAVYSSIEHKTRGI